MDHCVALASIIFTVKVAVDWGGHFSLPPDDATRDYQDHDIVGWRLTNSYVLVSFNPHKLG